MLCNRVFFNLTFWANCAHIWGVLRGAWLARSASLRDAFSAVERCTVIRLTSFTFGNVEIGFWFAGICGAVPAVVTFFARQVDFIT